MTETKKLYMRYDGEPYMGGTVEFDINPYVIYISNTTEVREHCRAIAEANGADAGQVETALAKLFTWLHGNTQDEVGTVDENSWYEHPRLNYADPAASTDAEGGVTEAVARLDSTVDDLVDGIGCDIETAVGRMVNDSVISKAESTVIEVCAEFMTRFFAEKVGAFEGARLA